MLYETIIPTNGHSFSKKNFIFKYFPTQWHYHKEYELLLITHGHGKRFAGDGVDHFKEGDIVLFGANLPHFHMSDKIYYENNDLYCSSEVIQFTKDIFPAELDKMPEFSRISALLKTSEQGILFQNKKITGKISEIFPILDSLSGIHLLTQLYQILDLLGSSKKYKLLSGFAYNFQAAQHHCNTPVNRTFTYLMNHFQENIRLTTIAAHAGQNHAALCRNFRQSTGKSIFECLTEIRIEFACKLLINSDLSVIQIAYESGFRNISHFNHKFKEMLKMTPIEYRKSLSQEPE